MNILHVSNYYYPHIGGIEQTARDIVNSSASYAEQRVICFSADKKTITEEVDGIKVIKCGTLLKVASQSISLQFNKLLKKQFIEFKPDLVIFHYPNPFQSHYLLKYLKKNKLCKLIVWWHLDITRQKVLGKLFNGQTQKLLKRADKIIATSPNYIEGSYFLSEYKSKCTVIPSCINENRLSVTEEVTEKAKKIREVNAGKTICFAVGRHVEYKGYEYLIKASALLDENFKIYIGGTGKLTEKLKEYAKNDAKIEFLGKLTDEDLKAYMTACDIYCFPSVTKNEAFGLALAEAMYFGKPAVTFTIEGSGVNFVSLKDVTGLEVENSNVQKYCEALNALASDSGFREKLGKAAKLRAVDLFTFNKFKQKISVLLRECQSGNKL